MTTIKPGDHVRHLLRPDVHGVVTHVKPVARGRVGVYLQGRRGAYSPDLLQVDLTPTPPARFQVGDRVRRVDHASRAMAVGSVWTVTGVAGDEITLDGDDWGPRVEEWFDPAGETVTDEPTTVEAVSVGGGWWDLDTGEALASIRLEYAAAFGLEVRVQARRKPSSS